jgi:hypothetical protein
MEDVGIFYGNSVYFKGILNILWPFGAFCGNLVYFSRFGMSYQEKSGNPVEEAEIEGLGFREIPLCFSFFSDS